MNSGKFEVWREYPLIRRLFEHIALSPVSFHMPGHNMGMDFPEALKEQILRMDLTEIPGLDDLHYPDGVIKEACDIAAQAFGADKTFFLVNGSSCGIHAAIMSVCREEDEIIVGRNCHRAVTAGITFAGASPIYLPGTFNKEYGILKSSDINDISNALNEHPKAKAVIITRPDYYGICPDIGRIAEMIHEREKILIVDEAHGAHLKFNEKLPMCALESGADIVVQSAHKTLPALTQGAYLHIKSDRVLIDTVSSYLRLLQTSSPSYMIMASLDYARGTMQKFGREKYDCLLNRIDEFSRDFPGINMIEESCHDKTRVVINVKGSGFTGYKILKKLTEYSIFAEMADIYNVVLITRPANTKEDFHRIGKAVCDIISEKEEKDQFLNCPDMIFDEIPSLEGIRPSKVMGRKGIWRRLDQCCGSISLDFIVPYPPGIPAVFPGQILNSKVIDYLMCLDEQGARINGIRKYENRLSALILQGEEL